MAKHASVTTYNSRTLRKSIYVFLGKRPEIIDLDPSLVDHRATLLEHALSDPGDEAAVWTAVFELLGVFSPVTSSAMQRFYAFHAAASDCTPIKAESMSIIDTMGDETVLIHGQSKSWRAICGLSKATIFSINFFPYMQRQTDASALSYRAN